MLGVIDVNSEDFSVCTSKITIPDIIYIYCILYCKNIIDKKDNANDELLNNLKTMLNEYVRISEIASELESDDIKFKKNRTLRGGAQYNDNNKYDLLLFNVMAKLFNVYETERCFGFGYYAGATAAAGAVGPNTIQKITPPYITIINDLISFNNINTLLEKIHKQKNGLQVSFTNLDITDNGYMHLKDFNLNEIVRGNNHVGILNDL